VVIQVCYTDQTERTEVSDDASHKGEGKGRRNFATSTWFEGTHNTNPKPSKVKDEGGKNQNREEAVAGMNPRSAGPTATRSF